MICYKLIITVSQLIENIGNLHSEVFGYDKVDHNSSQYIKVLWSFIKSLFQIKEKSESKQQNTNKEKNVNIKSMTITRNNRDTTQTPSSVISSNTFNNTFNNNPFSKSKERSKKISTLSRLRDENQRSKSVINGFAKCDNCKRTFAPDRLVVHQRGCKKKEGRETLLSFV